MSCRALLAILGFYSREVCAKPDLYFKRITPAAVWRKRACVAIGYYSGTQRRGNGALDHGGGSRNDGYLKAKLTGLPIDRKWAVSE